MRRFGSRQALHTVALLALLVSIAAPVARATPVAAAGPSRISLVGLADSLTDRILQSLARSRRFVPVEREALRKVVEEQRFGQERADDFVTQTLDGSIANMTDVSGFTVLAIGALAQFKDADNDIKDLGTAVGADILVVATLEKLQNRRATTTAVPYSREGRTSTVEVSDGRLLFRVVRVETGEVLGAGSIRSRLTENVYAGVETDTDDFTFLDQLAKEAAARIIDVTFPATVVSIDPLVVSRGTNDGVAAGDRYVVKREGKEVMDGGVSLGKLLSKVGTLELSDVNETMSIARMTSGSAFLVGDLVLVDTPADTADSGTAPASAVAAGKPLKGVAKPAGERPRVAMGTIKFGATGDPGSATIASFTDRIISGLAATKRFQMIDRQEVDQLLREQEAQAIAANRGLESAMGTLAGADYLVYGNVSLFDLQGESTRLPGSSRTLSQTVGRVDGTIRIVDARSGDILDSRNIEVRKVIDPNASRDRTVTTLANAYSNQLVTILLNAIYPIKVAALSPDGTVYINRGTDGGIQQGQTLRAFRPGEAVIDPDTGIQLGVQETLIGRVEVAIVEEARSRGRATTGSSLEVGDILRLDPEQATSSSSTRRSAKVGSGGKEKPTLAVGKIRIGDSSRVESSQRSYVRDLAGTLGVRLSQTNRFEVLERKEIDQVLDEKVFQAAASGGDLSAYLQELTGSDYLVYGALTDFRIETESQRIELLDEVQKRTSGVARLSIRIVDARAGSVLAADQVAVDQRLPKDGDHGSQLVDLLTTSSVKLILERVYPVRVIGLLPDQATVYLNRGEDGDLEVGTVLDLMRPGAEMIDPDTGQSFGSMEEKIGTIRVVSVEASRSRAELLSGGTPAVGDIGRSAPKAKKQDSPKKEEREFNRPAF